MELEELRKAGAAPAEVDDEGNMINPHIPQYMSEAPWYVSDGKPGLKHLKNFKAKKKLAKVTDFVRRGEKIQRSSRYRSGACKNCGAMSHKERDCCERPRKRNAQLTNSDIQPDEIIDDDLNFDYEGKRDSWKQYDINNHLYLAQYSEKVDAARRRKRDLEIDQMLKEGTVEKERLESTLDEKEEIKDSGIVIQQMNDKKRQTIRNLRTREDTAKYLRNLELDSAYYDPKTRSMRSNPTSQSSKKKGATDFFGDNFHRVSGDSVRFHQQQTFAVQLEEKGLENQKNLAMMASNPTKAEMISKLFEQKKEQFQMSKRDQIISKYGGSEYFHKKPPSASLPLEPDVLANVDKAVVCTKYDEDVLEGEHTEIWGSFYDISSEKWGYACCHKLKRGISCKE